MRFGQKLLSTLLIFAMMLTVNVGKANTALADIDGALSQAQLITMLVASYEFITDSEVDESAITSKLSTDKNMRKALELDLINDYEVGWTALNATRQNAVARILAFKNALRTRFCGGAAAQAAAGQARDELGLALKIMARAQSVNYAYEITAGLPDDEPLTRDGMAELIVKAYEALYGEIDVGDTQPPKDTDSQYVLKAMAAGLMSKYDVSDTFEPDEPVQLRQLAAPILMLTNCDSRALDEITKGEARFAVGEAMLSCIGVEPADGDSTRVLLDVNWDWYVNQLTTGKYSANNCMPACGEMVLNYLNRENRVTTQMLRALSPHDGKGWYDVELYDVLTGEGVNLESEYYMTAENMTRDLDEKHLLIVMCNFDGAETGHAMVVCGYESGPAGTWFICNDPESPTTNKYGKPSGYLRRVEAQELIAAMRRHVSRYFRVMN